MDDYIHSIITIKPTPMLSNELLESKHSDYKVCGCVYSQLGFPLHHKGVSG